MPKLDEPHSISLLDSFTTNGAGYDVLRYVSLPDLLGTEAHTLLYFMGRRLARKLTINHIEDIYHIYSKLGWGRLELVKEKKKHILFHLMSDSVVYRLKAPIDTEFRLEAGFLAEAMEQVTERKCECTEEVNKNIHLVEFKVLFT